MGFLGPAGTFTEEALVTREDLAGLRRQPFNSMLQVLKAVEFGVVDVGFVPIENMIEGGCDLQYRHSGLREPDCSSRTR
ncbi:MAG: hypothetical protein F4Y75_02780 [Acidimicrobiia bacterium]|nr:hypothetical protein [Acidimicrobiia bacterium]MXZ06431.1 hypothetical protein [Acidimicrobiia bacterium]MYF26481.1 hypothetical protein [Acidimicrobiia bacterium]